MGQIFVRASRRARAYVRGSGAARTYIKSSRLLNKLGKKASSISGINGSGTRQAKSLNKAINKVARIHDRAYTNLVGYSRYFNNKRTRQILKKY